MLYRRRPIRRGALLVESAVIYPALFFLLFGLIVGGLGIFRHQQVACQAREATRWASVRGARYQKETGQPSPTQDQILQNVVLPLSASMDPQKLAIQVEWIDATTGGAVPW